MKQEFEKLDVLMERTKPLDIKTSSFKGEIPKRRGHLLPALVGGFCTLLIVFSFVHRENQRINQVIELSEVLSWDFSIDETEDFEQTLAFLEGN